MTEPPKPEPSDPDEADDPELTAAMRGGTSAWVVAVVATDPDRPDIGDIAILTVVPTVSASTGDSRPGAERVDLVVTAQLARGFALVTSFDPAALLQLPSPDGWRLRLWPGRGQIVISEPDGTFYAGEIGPAAPPGWYEALGRHQRLIVLMASQLAERETVRDALDDARQAGNVVGAVLDAPFEVLD